MSVKVISRLFLLCSAALLCSGCGSEKTGKSGSNGPMPFPEFHFAQTTGPQRAVFLTQQGWTGGGGDPVLIPPFKATVRVNGRRVVLKSAAQELIAKNLGPRTSKHGEIRVVARVHLEARGSVYSVVIDELLRAEWN